MYVFSHGMLNFLSQARDKDGNKNITYSLKNSKQWQVLCFLDVRLDSSFSVHIITCIVMCHGLCSEFLIVQRICACVRLCVCLFVCVRVRACARVCVCVCTFAISAWIETVSNWI